MSAVNSPAHYRLPGGLEVYDVIAATQSRERMAGWCEGNVKKYMLRADRKGGPEDHEKALYYLERLVEMEKAMSGKGGFDSNPMTNRTAASADMSAAITQLMMDRLFGSGEEPRRPRRCGECDFCRDTGEDGIQCFAEPPKIVGSYSEARDSFGYQELRPTVRLGDPACRHGETRR